MPPSAPAPQSGSLASARPVPQPSRQARGRRGSGPQKQADGEKGLSPTSPQPSWAVEGLREGSGGRRSGLAHLTTTQSQTMSKAMPRGCAGTLRCLQSRQLEQVSALILSANE